MAVKPVKDRVAEFVKRKEDEGKVQVYVRIWTTPDKADQCREAMRKAGKKFEVK